MNAGVRLGPRHGDKASACGGNRFGEGAQRRAVARVAEDEHPRGPKRLTAEDAYELLRNSLKVFRDQHGHWPARVVLHKTSRFDCNEPTGFHQAVDERDIDYADFVWVQKSMTRLYRLGVYPCRWNHGTS